MKNRFTKKFLKEVVKVYPAILNDCPYNGTVELINITIFDSLKSTLPAAKYSTEIVLKDLTHKVKLHMDFFTCIEK
jgi:hypothetical protein